MVRRKNSFIITEISPKKAEEKSNEKVTERTKSKKRNEFIVKSKFSKSSKNKKFEPKIKTFKNKMFENEAKSESIPPKFKTNRFLKKCFNNRRKNGMILLSPKVEQKIYKLKKSLQKKGLEESEIIDIIRKRRREEEMKYNKEMSKSCFKCRRSGHLLADCPFNRDEAVDICYRCGSSEHKLSECGHKSEALPFASCFICKQTGHLTRDCTQNKRGVYPKGGECKACHSVNHLIKDCPQNQNEKELEKEITLTTFDVNHSVDAEHLLTDSLVSKTRDEKKKVIKF